MTTRLPKADIEEIAALLDGNLKGEERARLLEILAHDEASFALFEESAVALDEVRPREVPSETAEDLGQAPQERRAIPIERSATARRPSQEQYSEEWPRAWIYLPLAAALLAAAIGLFFWFSPRSGRSAQLVASFETLPRPDELTPYTVRGEETGGYFQAGRSALNVAILIAHGDSEESRKRLAEELGHFAHELGSGRSVRQQVAEIRGTAKKVHTGQLTPAEVSPLLARWEETLDESDRFRLGRWCHGAWIALNVGDNRYFDRREVHLLWQQVRTSPGFHPEVSENLKDIDELLAQGSLDAQRRQELREALSSVFGSFEED